jgi:hypothetical protein
MIKCSKAPILDKKTLREGLKRLAIKMKKKDSNFKIQELVNKNNKTEDLYENY